MIDTELRGKRILVALDIDYVHNALGFAWAQSLVQTLVADGNEVSVLARAVDAPDHHAKFSALGANLIEVKRYEDAGSEDETGVLPRYRARQIVQIGRLYDVVLVQGFDLANYCAGPQKLQRVLWSFIDDHPVTNALFTPPQINRFQKIAEGSRKIVVSSESQRSVVDSRCPQATSKTIVLPVLALDLADFAENSIEDLTQSCDYAIDLGMWRNEAPYFFGNDAETLRASFAPPRFVVFGNRDEHAALIKQLEVEYLPGVVFIEKQFIEAGKSIAGAKLLLPRSMTGSKLAYALQMAQRLGCQAKYATILSHEEGNASNVPEGAPVAASLEPFFARDFADLKQTPRRDETVRVVLAGSDFKFAGEIVETLLQRPDIDLRIDVFEHNSRPQPEKSMPYLLWADVIIAEFSSYNAIWYSKNVGKHQRLLVHLHGFELLQDWIEELRVDRCAAIIVASEFYRQKAIEMRGWPEQTVKVIPNSVNVDDLYRPKLDDARFHIGLVGIVPILKRPDRALDLLEALIEEDPRYTLHIRGHAPWNYTWEWQKAAHQDAYRTFYRRISENARLRRHISFEPFGPDMGNWLRKIGWLLSTSTRETFHMAAIEGATSGAVPIAWEREGSREIIGEAFNVSSTAEAIQRVVEANRSESEYLQLSAAAREHAQRYNSANVRALWLEEIFAHLDGTGADASVEAQQMINTDPARLEVFEKVEGLLEEKDFEGALATLDENIRLTAHHRGPLKDLELYVRGIGEADSRRFDMFLPEPDWPEFAKLPDFDALTDAILTVQPNGDDNEIALRYALTRNLVKVAPPNYLQLRSLDDAAQSADITATEDLRLDRWFEFVKSALIERLRDTSVRVVLATGPWWLAIPVAKAADQLGLRCAWLIDKPTVFTDVDLVTNRRSSTDAIAQLTTLAFERMDFRFVTDPEIVGDTAARWSVSGVLNPDFKGESHGIQKWRVADTPEALLSAESQRMSKSDAELEKQMAELHFGVVAGREFGAAVRETGAQITDLDPEYFEAQLDPAMDAVIVDIEANVAGPWKNLISFNKDQGATTAAKLMDRARALGIKTIFVYKRSAPVPKNYQATARKADTVVFASEIGMRRLFELNPLSARYGIVVPDRSNLLEAALLAGTTVMKQEEMSIEFDDGCRDLFLDESAEEFVEAFPPMERIGLVLVDRSEQEVEEFKNLDIVQALGDVIVFKTNESAISLHALDRYHSENVEVADFLIISSSPETSEYEIATEWISLRTNDSKSLTFTKLRDKLVKMNSQEMGDETNER
ncbi:glycosyltransferase family 4 protein [Corynebacterium sp. H130]|uniref:glycosyltransferase family 4 protein n=1 Tax=Corynebacterium sp. H130 TaxID=3133444 RepID=UPI0030A6400C